MFCSFLLARWQFHRWQKGSRTYAAYLHQSLFGDWQVQKIWGGKGRRGARSVTLPAASYAEALALLAAIAKRRKARGYQETESS
jgi:hypothetical protein